LPELEQRKKVFVKPLFVAIKDSFIARTTTQNVQVVISCDPSSACLGDVFLIQQALYNIFDNALDFINEGGEIHIQVIQEPSYVQIYIDNTG
ncbi:hypothetical protein SB816_31485, partial [Achromobacter sp. SIMBA_011]